MDLRFRQRNRNEAVGRAMAEVVDRRGPEGEGGAVATEIPSKNLPAISYRDMPNPLPLAAIVGPSVILLATSIGSGEYVLWPFITSQVGLTAMWMAVVGVFTQYFINMEIERYTLATGETAVTGFTRLWRPWGVIMALAALASWGWPGWAAGASTSLTYVFGWEASSVPWITVAALVAIGIALTASPIVYQAVEKAQMVMVALILVFLVAAIVLAVEGRAYADFVKGFSNVGQVPSEIPIATLLGALAFAGAGGTVNLVQSNWIRDKGLGMGAYSPKIVSPLTGEEQAAASTGYFFPQDEPNLRRWRGWWRVANQEQFYLFAIVGGLSIILLSLLTYSTVFGQEGLENNFGFIRNEGEVLKDTVAPWFGTAFWLTGVVVLLSTNLGVLDHMGRITADVLKVDFLRDNEFWTESKIYFAVIWAEIIFGSIVLLVVGITAPLVLLVISSATNGVIMFVYSILLIQLNRFTLPKTIRLRSYRLVAMAWAVLFFGFFSVILVVEEGGKLFGG
jgi:hypothetical protein